MAREKLPLKSPSEVSERTGSAVLLDSLPIIRERFNAVQQNTTGVGQLVKLIEKNRQLADSATPEGTVVNIDTPEKSLVDSVIVSARQYKVQLEEALHYAQLLGDWSLHTELLWCTEGLLAVLHNVREQPDAAAASLDALRARVTKLLEG